jgi:hypothetical protein
MIFPEAMCRGPLAASRVFAARFGAQVAHAWGNFGVVHEGRTQHRVSRRVGARTAEGRRGVPRTTGTRLLGINVIVLEVDLDDMNPLDAIKFITTNGTLPANQSLADIVGPSYARVSKPPRRWRCPRP